MLIAYELAGEQLREIAEASDGTVQVHGETTRASGYRQFDISVRFDGVKPVEDGLRVRAREQFQLLVPPTFPYKRPSVYTPHRRFACFPHVQWGYSLCLYQSSADWRPEDGMYGFVERLDTWIRDAALNQLDPDDVPLHPPVAYPTVDRLVVPRADTPLVEDSTWFGFAELRQRNHRTEIVGWRSLPEALPDHSALSILLHEPFPFEYPRTVRSLLYELESHHIGVVPLLRALAVLASSTDAGMPLVVILGTPMRRVRAGQRALQHLAVWQISGDDVNRLRQLKLASQGDDALACDEAIAEVAEWADTADVGWCRVREMRPEVTTRRDHSSPMAWFCGKRLAIWGCGAIGTHVAESLVRAGATRIQLVDIGPVNPGILVRQGFEDADIGRSKVDALADRLKRIEPDVRIDVSVDDLIHRLAGTDPIPDVDLVIDCTASSAVRMRLEQTLCGVHSRPPIASMAIDQNAATAMTNLSKSNHSGGPLDLVRRLKLEACRSPRLSKPLKGFWPRSTSAVRFQPEPGCSEPTFVGSNADLAGFSARMLNAVARALSQPDGPHTAAGWFFEEPGPVHAFAWPPDHTCQDQRGRYTVRVSRGAAREMRAWARRSARTAGPRVETGGLVFGELNEAAGVIWVTDIEGPPPDSDAAEDHFTCGTEGMEEAANERHERFRHSVEFLGSWHTHPTTAPSPSLVDLRAVAELLTAPESFRRTFVLLILSGDPDDPMLGTHVYRTTLFQGVLLHRAEQRRDDPATARPVKPRDVGLALSGGGSRAIAFHLGCLRALHDLRLLDRLQVISSVSGGSVISAMYAYSSDSFYEFDTRVVELLHRGLQRDIVRETLRPNSIRKVFQAQLAIGSASGARLLRHGVRSVLPIGAGVRKGPPIRNFSRSEAFRDVIGRSLFGGTLMRDVIRDSFDTVINATELRPAQRSGSEASKAVAGDSGRSLPKTRSSPTQLQRRPPTPPYSRLSTGSIALPRAASRQTSRGFFLPMAAFSIISAFPRWNLGESPQSAPTCLTLTTSSVAMPAPACSTTTATPCAGLLECSGRS